MQTKQDVIRWLDENQSAFTDLSDAIWDRPELGYHEFFASKSQIDFLAAQGFRIEQDIAGMNTAFVAEWGSGKPILGFAGEFDALGGLSQKNQAEKEPVIPDAPGHGCGHNLLGVGCLASAVALKEWLESTGHSGTVRYYGCPAEEGGAGKTFMQREGYFDDLDIAFNYHPSSLTFASKGSDVGVNHMRFQFHGKTAHAGGAPEMGRSALDAVELMNIGINYLREHVTDDVRLHYVITNGGRAPNIVPDEAEVWYYVRAHDPKNLHEVTERVRKVANGAAMMTETQMEEIFESATSSTLPNFYLSDLQYEQMKLIGPITYTEEEKAFAALVNEQLGFTPEMARNRIERFTLTDELRSSAMQFVNEPLIGQYFPALDLGHVGRGSTDVGDLSRTVPCSMLWSTCWCSGAPGHSWAVTAFGRNSIGHKGMMFAAKTMALAAVECVLNPEHIEKAWEEFKQAQPEPYVNPIPEGINPPRYEPDGHHG
ncbi:MAG: amidohydrolase [Anaerolineaceae bacterium]|nr:amidohydrolase [Anaerolineaceae bacterium]